MAAGATHVVVTLRGCLITTDAVQLPVDFPAVVGASPTAMPAASIITPQRGQTAAHAVQILGRGSRVTFLFG